MTQRAIEVSFPIIEINRLAVPERNAFKPIYQMHKWFARRASCVFRAILLGCMKSAGTDIMAEYYSDHTNDPDTNGKTILDPFMGGGTTVVEALRLGCKVTGIDLNPVAWFIVKSEIEPIDADGLRSAFDRLAERRVAWSGKSVRETLLEQYKTECPCCGNTDADIMYTFWVKSAICTGLNCGKQVPLFSNYIVAEKSPSIRFWRDVRCPKCKKRFDWEIEPAALVGQQSLMRSDPSTDAGLGRSNVRWAFSADKTVRCPWCNEVVQPEPPKSKTSSKLPKPERKKIPLSVLLCPHCESVWQWRGTLPAQVTCPVCRGEFKPRTANLLESGKFVCPSCGNKDAIISSVRRLPDDQLLPLRPYAIEGYCSHCAAEDEDKPDSTDEPADLFGGMSNLKAKRVERPSDHACTLNKNKGKFFKRVTAADVARYQTSCETWEREKENLPYPRQEIPLGEKTKSGLINHHYCYWYQMFNPRQLLSLATILNAIAAEEDTAIEECLLGTFQYFVERQNLFTHYFNDRNTVQGNFDRHDFQPKTTPAENSAWGRVEWRGTFPNMFERTAEGITFQTHPYDFLRDGSGDNTFFSNEEVLSGKPTLLCADSSNLSFLEDGSADFVITDPPYVGNVNYAELSDFFYVWLRQLLANRYATFAPEQTPKATEVIENPTRGKSNIDFERDITQVLVECGRVLKPDGLLVFTFHHAENQIWEMVLRSLMNAGFELTRAFPVHGEKEFSTQLQATEGIAYDLIHVCKKRDPNMTVEKRSWAGIRQQIRRSARDEIRAIEASRYGGGSLSPADITIVLIGKCLELYSRHYGAVVDHDGTEVTLHSALIEIRSMVDQLVQKEQPLPAELEDIDAESRVYLLTLCTHKEIKSDSVHKATRGILEPDDLIEAGLMTKGHAKRSRTYEVRQPAERFNALLEAFGEATAPVQPTLFGDAPEPKTKRRTLFVDKVHLLMGLAQSGENLMPWLARFRGDTPRLRAACEFLAERNAAFEPTLRKIVSLIDPLPLFKG